METNWIICLIFYGIMIMKCTKYPHVIKMVQLCSWKQERSKQNQEVALFDVKGIVHQEVIFWSTLFITSTWMNCSTTVNSSRDAWQNESWYISVYRLLRTLLKITISAAMMSINGLPNKKIFLLFSRVLIWVNLFDSNLFVLIKI